MQVFFCLSYYQCKRKFQTEVTDYLETLDGYQRNDMKGTGWDAFTCLINVKDKIEALQIRKEVERRCKKAKRGHKPYYFRLRNLDAKNVDTLSLFGLTPEESKRFKEKAPPGVYRTLQV